MSSFSRIDEKFYEEDSWYLVKDLKSKAENAGNLGTSLPQIYTNVYLVLEYEDTEYLHIKPKWGDMETLSL